MLKDYWKLRCTILKGVIPPKYKELMAVAFNILLNYEPGIRNHAVAAVHKGATREELLETILFTVPQVGMRGWALGRKVLDLAKETSQKK